MCVCMYVCIHVCMYESTYVCMHTCMYVCMHTFMYECMYVCTYERNVCMYVCMSTRVRPIHDRSLQSDNDSKLRSAWVATSCNCLLVPTVFHISAAQ
jgi:hypothetical protein